MIFSSGFGYWTLENYQRQLYLMTPQNLANPESSFLSTSHYTQITNHRPHHVLSPTGYKTQDLNHSKLYNQNTITPSKKPKWQETTSTHHTADRLTTKQQKIVVTDEQKLKDQMEYVAHLRNILKHLEDTTLILENNRKHHKEIYEWNIKQMTATKNQLQLKQLLLQEQFEELRQMIKQKQQKL